MVTAKIYPFPVKPKELWGTPLHERMAETQKQLHDGIRAYSEALKAGKMDAHIKHFIELKGEFK